MNPFLLAAYAYSAKHKSDKLQAQAISAEKSKTAVRNYIKGPGGIKYLAPNATIPEGYSLYGFTIGNKGTMNKYDKEIEPNIDLYEHPVNKGELITKAQHNSLNKGYSSIDQADSTTTTKYPLGSIVAQRSPANNALNYMKGYNPFKIKEDVTYKYSKKVGDTYVPVDSIDKGATHSQKVTTKGDKTITEPPVEIKGALQEITKQEFGFMTPSGFVSEKRNDKPTHVREITTINNEIVKTGQPSLIKEPTTKLNEKIIYFAANEKGGVGSKLNSIQGAKFSQKVKIDDKGKEVPVGKPEPIGLAKIKEEDNKKLKLRVEAVSNGAIMMVSQEKAFELRNKGTHIITGQQVGDGKIEEYESSVSQKDKINNVKSNKDVSATFSHDTGKKDSINFKPIKNYFTAYVKQKGTDNLTRLNNFMNKNPDWVKSLNKDKNKEESFRSFFVSELKAHFEDRRINAVGNVTFSKTRPRFPDTAYSKMITVFPEFAKLKGGQLYASIAAGIANDNVSKELENLYKTDSGTNDNQPLVVNKVVKNNQTNEEEGVVTTVTGYPKQYKPLIQTLSGVIGKSRNADEVNGLIESLIVYDKNNDGSLKKTANGNLVPSKQQPALGFLDLLRNTNLGNSKINGRQATYLDGFLSIIHPFPRTAPLKNINKAIQIDIVNKFGTLVKHDFEKAKNVIAAFTIRNTGAVNALMEEFYGNEYNEQKVKSEVRGKSGSAYNAISTIDSMARTYVTDNGQFINLNTRQGELVVSGLGAYRFGEKFVQLFKGNKPLDIVAVESSTLADALVDQGEIYESVNPNDEKEIAARQRNQEAFQNVKNIINGTGDINALIQKLPKSVQRQIGGGDAKLANEIIRKLAVRQYHKYMLAYQLAAAIQGGTGGRTISDQDVENIMRSLNFGFFSPPETELAVLQEARKMMVDIYNYNEGILDPDPAIQFASLKARQLLMNTKRNALFKTVQARRNYITGKIRLASGGSTGDTTDGSNKITNFGLEKKNKIESIIKQEMGS
tara:strand:+ start:1954 stop:4983 length:3030 start_codon:yes stop_codon:yes gene_type:complete